MEAAHEPVAGPSQDSLLPLGGAARSALGANMSHLVVMAAGTGGHVIPGLAVAREMQQRGWSVSWLGTTSGMENKLVPPSQIPLDRIGFSGLRGKGWLHTLTGGLRLLKAFWDCLSILRRRGADAVLGMGGYVCFPGGLMASLLGKPLLLVNADAALLLSNKALLPVADRVAFGFDGADAARIKRAVVTGNPVRAEIEAIAAPDERFAARSGPLQLLVVGGSLGAKVLNDTLPAALRLMPVQQRPHITHQTGVAHIDAVREAYREAGVEAELLPFIDDMAERLAGCDLMICRAGAGTVSELCAAGVPALLVPLIVSTTAHQRDNAEYMARHGAAMHQPADRTERAVAGDAVRRAGRAPRQLLQHGREGRAAGARPHAAAAVGRRDATKGWCRRMKHAVKHIHFVGVGGAGMSGIAEILHNLGYTVSGSDQTDSATSRRLARLGIRVFIGHDAAHIAGAEAVVTSTAVKGDNPEVIAARAKRVPVVPRAVMLAELMRLKQGIAIAGTHGKTTTTSLVTSVLAEAGVDPTFVVGGLLNSAGANSRLGSGEYIVVEADESDASFLNLMPVLSVVTNIDADHMETYGHDFARLKAAFVEFVHRMPFYGAAIVCGDDPGVRSIVPMISRPVVTYGLDEGAMVRAVDVQALPGGQMRFVAQRRNGIAMPELHITLNLPGEHNVRNALAALAVTTELELPDAPVVRALANFTGVGRRFQRYGELPVPAARAAASSR